MKMTVLNLRKIGFAVVAASSMLVFSCGAEETPEATEATPATTEPAPEVTPEPVAEPVAADTAAACDGTSCEDAH